MKKIAILIVLAFSFIRCSEPKLNIIESEPLSDEDIELDTARHIVEELKKKELILGENDFGNLTLVKDRELSLDTLTTFFPDYSVIQEVGHQNGPDYTLFQISKGKRIIASVKMNSRDQKVIDEIQISDTTVLDEFGFSVGDKFSDLLATRAGLETSIEDRSHVIVTEVGSPIGYIIEENSGAPYHDQLSNEELMNWKITSLIWFNPEF
jgi:hypothetical protein